MRIGVDDTLGLIHRIETTAANVHDLNLADRPYVLAAFSNLLRAHKYLPVQGRSA